MMLEAGQYDYHDMMTHFTTDQEAEGSFDTENAKRVTQEAIQAIENFQQALASIEERVPIKKKNFFWICTGLLFAATSMFAIPTGVAIMDDTSESGWRGQHDYTIGRFGTCDVYNHYPLEPKNCFEGLVEQSLAAILRNLITEGQGTDWADAIFRAAEEKGVNLDDNVTFLRNTVITELHGLKALGFKLRLNVPGRISSGTPWASFGLVTLAALIGVWGTSHIESIGWKSPPLSLSEYRQLRNHIRTLEQNIDRLETWSSSISLDDFASDDSINASSLQQALEKGRLVKNAQHDAYVCNITYISKLGIQGAALYLLALFSMWSSRALVEQYEWNTFERFGRMPLELKRDALLEFSVMDLPIPGAQQALHTTTSYPDEDFYDNLRIWFLVGVLVAGVVYPILNMLRKIPYRRIGTAVETSMVSLGNYVFQCQTPAEYDILVDSSPTSSDEEDES